jgi:hypothetical protein
MDSPSSHNIFKQKLQVYLKKEEGWNMPLGPNKCNGSSGYRDSTIPSSLLRWSKGSIPLLGALKEHSPMEPPSDILTHTNIHWTIGPLWRDIFPAKGVLKKN